MKKLIVAAASAAILISASVHADEILEVHPDHAVGGGFGGLSGFMVGAVGGPIGALVGGGLGWLLGSGVQDAAGLEQTLYVVRKEDGSIDRIRSSNGSFLAGQHIRRDGAEITAMRP
ncbi:hypothetical protein BSR09_06385 [Stutzerimonas degradans]|jgi:outer membrane lipoprotein SlyB|nr:hypothetical protein [Pseudomonadaceae bacterium]OOE13407.1 hypothetical protein BSR09_06385 [Stutzerimonas degradans]QCT95515.1 hypothetical protein FEV13_00750 [Stutzerimonas degradans]QGW22095.1 hypothetical protein GOM96_14220 [Stutzerimonas degradans]